MKKLIIATITALTLAGIFTCGYALPLSRYLMNYSDYKKIKPDNIKSLKIIKYTEGGVTEQAADSEREIIRTYNKLKEIKLKGKTNMSCTDNTTIYSFLLTDGSKVSIEFECDWVVIKGKSYSFTK